MTRLALAAAVLTLPALAHAQQPPDPKWNAWTGCWELVLERAADSTPPARRDPRAASRGTVLPQVCVDIVAGGARFTTTVGNRPPLQHTVIADGTERPTEEADCRGTERTEWSRDGLRLYVNADLVCGAQGSRHVSGYSILGANGTWTDIQAVDISGQQTIRVRRYRRAAAQARSSEPSPLTLDDVAEAATKVSSPALEAALVETRSTFRLSGKDLIALQDAKVPSSVTDLMIALSYPETFVVERSERTDLGPPLVVDDPFFLGWAFGYPAWWDTFGSYSSLYGPYSPYFFSPFSYSYARFYDPRLFGGGYVVIGDGIGGGGGGVPSIRPSGNARAVDGLGYTRVRSREATASPGSTSLSSGGSSSSSGGGNSGSSGSSSGSGVSSQGFSSGGGGDTGRTAQPR